MIRALLATALASLVLPAVAAAQSAYPLKSPGDSGQIPANDFSMSDETDGYWVRGYDACVYTKPYDQFTLTFQQYNVAGCVAVQTPWIKLSAWKTQGWAIYCPPSAPNSWVDSLGGALQQWSTTESVENMNESPGGNSFGPSPPAKSDYYTTNWSFHRQYWLYVVGCSPTEWENPGDGGNYCCGQGPSGAPVFGSAAVAGRPRAARFARGPARRRTAVKPGYYTETREFELRPSTRRTYRASCASGHRLRFTRWGVGWYTRRPPGARDGDVRERAREIRRRAFELTVRTDRRVKRRQVRLQLHVGCGRPGVDPPRRSPTRSPLG
jgi:hypothetical protein